MSAYTNFQDGDTLTADKLNEAFGLIDTKVDLVLPAAQEAVETASQTATAVQEMSRVMTETFARQQREIDDAVDSVADKTSKSYVDAGDEANSDKIDEVEEDIRADIGTALGQTIDVCKNYTVEKVDDLEDDLTTAYTAADTNTLNAAKTYADGQDATTLSDANEYADGVLGDAKDYADAQDATNLAAAKSYTDDAIAGFQPAATTYKLAFIMEVGDTDVSVTKSPALASNKNWEVTLYTEDPEFVPATFTHTFNTFNATDVFTLTFPEITDADVSGYLKIVEVS